MVLRSKRRLSPACPFVGMCLLCALFQSAAGDEPRLQTTFKTVVQNSSVLTSGPYISLVMSGDGKLAAVSSGQDTIALWNTKTGENVGILAGHTGEVQFVAISSNGTVLASASKDGTIRLWDLNARRTTATIAYGDNGVDQINALAVSGDGRLVAGGLSGKVKIWETASRQLKAALNDPPSFSNLVTCISFSPDNKSLVHSLYKTSEVLLGDLEVLSVKPIKGHTSMITAVLYSPDGKLLSLRWLRWQIAIVVYRSSQGRACIRRIYGKVTCMEFGQWSPCRRNGGQHRAIVKY